MNIKTGNRLISAAAVIMMAVFILPFAAASLEIAPWYPQGMNYVFVCNPDFAAEKFGWDFGDGNKLYNIDNGNVYHTYTQPGEYEVACTGSGSNQSKTSLLRITVGTQQLVPAEGNASAELTFGNWYPKVMDYIFECKAQGFTASSYDWDFGDGQKLIDVSNDNVYHIYNAPGVYDVDCTASDGQISRVAQVKIIAGAIPEQPTEVKTAAVQVQKGFPITHNYVFECSTGAFDAATYSWYFGDGEKLLDMTSSGVYHTFQQPGTYQVMCETKDATGQNLAKGSMTVTVT